MCHLSIEYVLLGEIISRYKSLPSYSKQKISSVRKRRLKKNRWWETICRRTKDRRNKK